MVRLKEALHLGPLMFQAVGVHGPELTPLAHAAMNVLLVTVTFALLFAGRRPHRSVVAGLATLVVVVAALRVLLQPLPNVQPVTVAALLIGSHLGARRGAAFAVLVALLSNLLIGDGWWTLFQALGWAGVAWLGSRIVVENERGFAMGPLVTASFASAFLFGFITTLSLAEPGMTVGGFVHLVYLGLPFDLVHAFGNVAFALWFGPALHRFLRDVRTMEGCVQPVGDVHVVHG